MEGGGEGRGGEGRGGREGGEGKGREVQGRGGEGRGGRGREGRKGRGEEGREVQERRQEWTEGGGRRIGGRGVCRDEIEEECERRQEGIHNTMQARYTDQPCCLHNGVGTSSHQRFGVVIEPVAVISMIILYKPHTHTHTHTHTSVDLRAQKLVLEPNHTIHSSAILNVPVYYSHMYCSSTYTPTSYE